MNFPIYMDHNATTPMDPRVLEAMMPYFTKVYGNAASRSHQYGWEAEEAVENARKQIADLIGATTKEIVFTSGATESDNLALMGIAEMYASKGNHIITLPTEHKAIIDTCKYLERHGKEVTYLSVDEFGMVDLDALRNAIKDTTILVSIMMANNEIGTIQPVAEIGKICREKGVIFHTDATQGVGKIPVDVNAMNIDLMSFTAHKMYGPKGVGALYVRKKSPRVKLSEQMHGGGHERGMRSGTLNVPGIVGFGKACEICNQEMESESKRLTYLRDKMINTFLERVEYSYLNGHPTQRLPHNVNVSFEYVEGEGLMMGIKDLAVSSGSACTSATLEPSYVLKALGRGDELAHSSIRYGLGRFTTEEEVDFAIEQTIETVNHLRELSPLWEMFKEGIDLKSVQWAAH
ncbi:MAG: IscS subfamily cysteine desulfurase [Bacteroidetes bacterium]|jgi:cysteine desulfurase|nr:IscS subfamily cysteine desulfurase [Bacteroidota bacterium]